MIEKMPHGVSLHGRVVLRGGKFDKYFNFAVPAGVSADDLKKCFADAGVNMAMLLRLFDKSQIEKEAFMPWKRCDVCKEDFDTMAEVCPHHTGHILTLISPQPVEATGPVEPVKAESLEPEAQKVMEESIDRAREVSGAQMESEMMGQAPGEPGEEEPCKSQE